MFNLQAMNRQFTSGRFDQLLKSVLHHGMELPTMLQNHLLDHPVCSTALCLKRAMEISYGRPDSQCGQMVAFLLQTQEDNGSFGFAPLPTACALAALTSMRPNILPAIRPERLRQAQAHARKALQDMIHNEASHGLPCTNLHDTALFDESDALDWAFILQLLSDDPKWKGHLATEKLHRWFNAHASQLSAPILRIWHRTCWSPAPGNPANPGNPENLRTSAPTENPPNPESGSFKRDISGNSKTRMGDTIMKPISVHGRMPRQTSSPNLYPPLNRHHQIHNRTPAHPAQTQRR